MDKILVQMTEFNNWANEKYRAAFRGVEFEKLHAKTVYGPFIDLPVHMFAWVEGWSRRIQGENIRAVKASPNFSSWEEIDKEWARIDRDFLARVTSLGESELNKGFKYTSLEEREMTGRVRNVILQLLHHQMYHRGQIAIVFRQFGFQPLEDIHYIDFLLERGLW